MWPFRKRPKRASDVEARRADALSRLLEEAIGYMPKCEFAAQLIPQFRDDQGEFKKAKCRYHVFSLWCTRAGLEAATRNRPSLGEWIQPLFDRYVSAKAETGDLRPIGEVERQFQLLGAALRDPRAYRPGADAAASGMYWMTKAAWAYVFGANLPPYFDNFAAAGSPDEVVSKLMSPSITMLKIADMAKRAVDGLE